jgi:hypothetical protein
MKISENMTTCWSVYLLVILLINVLIFSNARRFDTASHYDTDDIGSPEMTEDEFHALYNHEVLYVNNTHQLPRGYVYDSHDSEAVSMTEAEVYHTASKHKLNVLHIVADDLRPDILSYGVEGRITPNIDKLVKTGVVFDHAYCQIAVCGPSRNSFLSGRRPDASKSWNMIDHFRTPGPNWHSLPGE